MIKETFQLFKKVVMSLLTLQNYTMMMNSLVHHMNQSTQRLLNRGILICEKEVTASNQRLLYLLLDYVSEDVITNDMMVIYSVTYEEDVLDIDKTRLKTVHCELEELSSQLEGKGVSVNEANFRNTGRVLLFA